MADGKGNPRLQDVEHLDRLGDTLKQVLDGSVEALATLLDRGVSFAPDGVIVIPEPPVIDKGAEKVVAEVNISRGIEGSCLLLCAVSDAAALTDLLLGGTGARGEVAGEQLDTLGELVNQATGAAVAAAAARYGVSCSHAVQRVFKL
ncbi:MAG: hypothetical protein NUV93_09815, partial [Firmicutes bacterium]|nr:hypothetical protein [Bacillota bacterium]